MRVVCVLSGGGAKAAAHLGAIKALEEWGLAPAHYVATSMGAVIAACLAAGWKYEQLVPRFLAIRRSQVAVPSARMLLGPFAGHVLRGTPLRETIALLVPAMRFDELRTPLTVTAVDAKNGELVLFGAGGIAHVPLVDALYASCALPLYYPPARIGDRRYVDGGVRAVLPIDVAADFRPDVIVAVSVGPSLYEEPSLKPARLPPMVRAHGEALRIMMAAQTEEVLARWKNGPVPLVLVQPPLDAEATFAVDNLGRFVEGGYRAAYRALWAWRDSD